MNFEHMSVYELISWNLDPANQKDPSFNVGNLDRLLSICSIAADETCIEENRDFFKAHPRDEWLLSVKANRKLINEAKAFIAKHTS
jgi:hypothetical protein